MPILYKVNTETIEGQANARNVLLNPTGFFEVETVESTKTRFTYSTVPGDRRDGGDIIKVTEGIAAWRTALGTVSEVDATLPVFADNDSTKATSNKDYQASDIVWAENVDANITWVHINRGSFKTERKLVDLNIDEIITLVTIP